MSTWGTEKTKRKQSKPTSQNVTTMAKTQLLRCRKNNYQNKRDKGDVAPSFVDGGVVYCN